MGNFGSSQRFAYTVVGDQVNLGARLENLNKDYETARHIIISQGTYELVRDHVVVRPLGSVTVKGKHQAVRHLRSRRSQDTQSGGIVMSSITRWLTLAGAVGAALLTSAGPAGAQTVGEAQVILARAPVEVVSKGQTAAQPLQKGARLSEGDRVRTGKGGAAEIVLGDGRPRARRRAVRPRDRQARR